MATLENPELYWEIHQIGDVNERLIISTLDNKVKKRSWFLITRSKHSINMKEICGCPTGDLDSMSTVCINSNTLWCIGGSSIYSYDLTSDLWSLKEFSLCDFRSNHISLMTKSGICCVIGGNQSNDNHKNVEIFRSPANMEAYVPESHGIAGIFLGTFGSCCDMEEDILSFAFLPGEQGELYIWGVRNNLKLTERGRSGHWESSQMNQIIASQVPLSFESAIICGTIFSVCEDNRICSCDLKCPSWKFHLNLPFFPKKGEKILVLGREKTISIIYKGGDNRMNFCFYSFDTHKKKLVPDGKHFAFTEDFELSTALFMSKEQGRDNNLINSLKFKRLRDNESYQYMVACIEDPDFSLAKRVCAIGVNEEPHHYNHQNILGQFLPSDNKCRPCFHDGYYISLNELFTRSKEKKLILFTTKYGEEAYHYHDSTKKFNIIVEGILKGMIYMLEQGKGFKNLNTKNIVFCDEVLSLPKLIPCVIEKDGDGDESCECFAPLATLIEQFVSDSKLVFSPALESLMRCLKGEGIWKSKFQDKKWNEFLSHPFFLNEEKRTDLLFRTHEYFRCHDLRHVKHIPVGYLDLSVSMGYQRVGKWEWKSIFNQTRTRISNEALVSDFRVTGANYSGSDTWQFVKFIRDVAAHCNDIKNRVGNIIFEKKLIGMEVENLCPRLIPLLFEYYGSLQNEDKTLMLGTG